MKKFLALVLTVLVFLSSIVGTFTVSASEENLLEDISTSNFGTNDTLKCPISGFDQYQDSLYGKAFKVNGAWYTSFYIKLPALDVNTKYNLSFKYDNIIDKDDHAKAVGAGALGKFGSLGGGAVGRQDVCLKGDVQLLKLGTGAFYYRPIAVRTHDNSNFQAHVLTSV